MKFSNLLLLAAVAVAAPYPVADDASDIANADSAGAVADVASVEQQPANGQAQVAPDAPTTKPSANDIKNAAKSAGATVSDADANKIANAYQQSDEAGDQAVAQVQGTNLPDASNGVIFLPKDKYFYFSIGGKKYQYFGFHRGHGWKWAWGLQTTWTCKLIIFCYPTSFDSFFKGSFW